MVPLFVDDITPPPADLYVLLKLPPSADLFVLLTSSSADLYLLLFFSRTVPAALSFSLLWRPTSPPRDCYPCIFRRILLALPPSEAECLTSA
jgi:hypothetical protein